MRVLNKRVVGVFLAATLVVSLAACSGKSKKPAASSAALVASAAPSSPSASPSPSPTKTAKGWTVSPLTGTGKPNQDLVIIKVDNSQTARQIQKGFADAALVFEEPVEYGVTRYAMVFQGDSDVVVGPCRSGRESDTHIFAPYGDAIFGYSGAAASVDAILAQSKLVLRGQGQAPGAYTFAGSRSDANNYYTSPKRLIDAGGPKGKTVDVGFTFGPISSTAKPVKSAKVTFSSYIADTWTWSGGKWVLTRNDQTFTPGDGKAINPSNIIIQQVSRHLSGAGGYPGEPAKVTNMTGTGKAWVLRDGKMVEGTWKRGKDTDPTRYFDSKNHFIPLKTGQSWVLLVPDDAPAPVFSSK